MYRYEAIGIPKLMCSVWEPTSTGAGNGFGSKGTIAQTIHEGNSYFLLGAPNDGVAFIVTLASSDNECKYLRTLKLADKQANDRFGAAVGIGSNGLLLVGAPGYTRWTNPCPGAECIDGLLFFLSNCWGQTQTRTKCDDACISNRFECSPPSTSSICTRPAYCLPNSAGGAEGGMLIGGGGRMGVVLPGPAEVTCGNGRREANEECDDGMSPPFSGDGCSTFCTVELGFVCRGGGPSTSDACVFDKEIYLDVPHVRGTFYLRNMHGMLSETQLQGIKEVLARFANSFAVQTDEHVISLDRV